MDNCIIGNALTNYLAICIGAIKQWQEADSNQNTVEILEQWHANEREAITARESHWMKCNICNPKVEE